MPRYFHRIRNALRPQQDILDRIFARIFGTLPNRTYRGGYCISRVACTYTVANRAVVVKAVRAFRVGELATAEGARFIARMRRKGDSSRGSFRSESLRLCVSGNKVRRVETFGFSNGIEMEIRHEVPFFSSGYGSFVFVLRRGGERISGRFGHDVTAVEDGIISIDGHGNERLLERLVDFAGSDLSANAIIFLMVRQTIWSFWG